MTAALAPEPARSDLLALHAFHSELARVPELVSEPALGSIRLAWWREALAGLYNGHPPEHPVLAALARARTRTELARDMLEDMIAARALDLDESPPADNEALLHYVGGTSGALAALAATVLGADARQARAARHVGIGWGLAGLLRGLPAKASRGCSLVPADLLRAAGIPPSELSHAAHRAALAGVVTEIVGLARAHLALARARLDPPPRTLLPALLLGSLAGSYLRTLRRARFDPFAANYERAALVRRIKVLARRAQGRF